MRSCKGAITVAREPRRRVRSSNRLDSHQEMAMADKSPKKTTNKTAAAKSLKEKRADKKDKAATKRRDS